MHPVLFNLPTPWGAIPVYTWGTALGLALLAAWLLVMHEGARRRGIRHEILAYAFVTAAVGGFVGARLLAVAAHPEQVSTLADLVRRGGELSAYGALVGAALGGWAYLRTRQEPFLPWADACAPAWGLTVFLTRLGCWWHGCDFGKPLNAGTPEWVARLGTFPHWRVPDVLDGAIAREGAPAWSWHRHRYDLAADAAASLPVHPLQLYEALLGLGLFALAVIVGRNRRIHGQVLLATASAYALARLGLETLADGPGRNGMFGITLVQVLSALLLIASIAAWMKLRRRRVGAIAGEAH